MAMQLAHSAVFSEKKLVSHTVGKDTVMVYPRLTSDMPLAEKVHAFNINKNALESINLPTKTFVRQLGDTLGCGPVVTFTAGAFEEVAEKHLRANISPSATT